MKTFAVVKMLFLGLKFSSKLILKSVFLYRYRYQIKSMKEQVYYIKISFGSFRLRIRLRTNYSDLDPTKRFGSFRIRIHNTA